MPTRPPDFFLPTIALVVVAAQTSVYFLFFKEKKDKSPPFSSPALLGIILGVWRAHLVDWTASGKRTRRSDPRIHTGTGRAVCKKCAWQIQFGKAPTKKKMSMLLIGARCDARIENLLWLRGTGLSSPHRPEQTQGSTSHTLTHPQRKNRHIHDLAWTVSVLSGRP